MLAGLFLLVLPCAGQLQLGEEMKMNLSGDVGTNYNGASGSAGSSHGLGFTGNANLNGSYYNPSFLSFGIQPYYGRTQENSALQSITDSAGVNANVSLFSGSHFPGSLNYSRGSNTVGQFGVPGSTSGLASHGDTQGFGIGWSALVPGLPTLSASYAIGSGSSSIFGSSDESTQSDRNFSLRSTYSLLGFRLAGGYTHLNNEASFSEFLEGGQQAVNSDSSSNSYELNAQHSFPMAGSLAIGWNHFSYTNSSDGVDSSGASNALNANLTFHPVKKLSLGLSGGYNDSLLGTLPQQVVITGGSTNLSDLGTFRSFLVTADANYQLLNNLGLHALVNHQEQQFLGKTYDSTQFAANVNYNLQRRFLGSLSFSLGVFDSANKEGNTALGTVANLNFFRKMGGWDVSANLSYSQNVQTLLVVYTTSSLGYVASASRRIGNRVFWYAGYSGSHSAITQQAGTSSSSERVSSTFMYHSYNVNGYYSTSRGTALFTPGGLVATPTGLPPAIFGPDATILFNSTAYGFNVATSQMRRLTLSAGYSDARSDTVNPLLSTFTRTNLINGLARYRFRKLYFNAGYTKLRQSIGTPGSVPVVVTSYYAGISRWFNFF